MKDEICGRCERIGQGDDPNETCEHCEGLGVGGGFTDAIKYEMRGKIKNEKVKRLLMEYNSILKQLHKLNIIRTPHIVGEIGEWYAAQKFQLKLAESTQQKGYDAIDPMTNQTYQIKAGKDAIWHNSTTKNSQLFNVKELNADFLICIGFDTDWDIVTCVKIPKETANRFIMSGTININRAFITQNPNCYFLEDF